MNPTPWGSKSQRQEVVINVFCLLGRVLGRNLSEDRAKSLLRIHDFFAMASINEFATEGGLAGIDDNGEVGKRMEHFSRNSGMFLVIFRFAYFLLESLCHLFGDFLQDATKRGIWFDKSSFRRGLGVIFLF